MGGTGTILCALDGCADAAPLSGVLPLPPSWAEMRAGMDDLWLVRVEEGKLVDLTRTIDRSDWLRTR